jgi:hypothetical protein
MTVAGINSADRSLNPYAAVKWPWNRPKVAPGYEPSGQGMLDLSLVRPSHLW